MTTSLNQPWAGEAVWLYGLKRYYNKTKAESCSKKQLLLIAILKGIFILLFSSAFSTVLAQNAIVSENALPGTPSSEWQISGAGDLSIQGFATDISYNKGQTARFKIKTTASAYTIRIYRLGYYQGNGARFQGTATVTATLPQSQPTCLTNGTTGLIDCGNWAESANWPIPANAVSGIYIAKLTSSAGSSHITFIVRDDAGTSDLLFQTSDATWQAYNIYGDNNNGKSLYTGAGGKAVKVSYNRPFLTRSGGGGGGAEEDFVFNAEYPMIRFLESNGYDVSYTTNVDTDRRGNLIQNHKVFLSVGHDEYWSKGMRDNVTAARNAGKHLAFFSGNEVYWKTRWENSIDASGTSHRTLVCYKEGAAGENTCNGKCDPSPEWTGLWRSGCEYPNGGACLPENELTGQISWAENTVAMLVPSTYKNLRFWRNTSVASLSDGQTATLTLGTIGYEWNAENENFRATYPLGRIILSRTLINGQVHNMSLYRHSSGSLVFGAGTVQYSWGLDSNHDRGSAPASLAMQQATVNLFADMGVQPGSRQPGLVAATASSDTQAPTVSITSPSNGATIQSNTAITITGTATDAAAVVAGVEVSTDGGTTWRLATGTTNWTYSWTPTSQGAASIRSRAYDDSGNMSSAIIFNVTVGEAEPVQCPCTIFPSSEAPAGALLNDGQALQIGMKIRSTANGYITGVRFYKQTGNSGAHIGQLYNNTGGLLAEATFINETASGWQEVAFDSPVAITANTTYVISCHSSAGFYSETNPYFTTTKTNGPIQGLASGVDGPNGVYRYTVTPAFPNSNYETANYWVDAVFNTTTSTPSNQAPAVSISSPANGSSFTAPASINLTATASDADGTISKVEFYNGSALLSTVTSNPYSYSWNNVGAGTYILTARAYDNAGAVTTSNLVSVVVNAPPTVSITSPANNATFTDPASITINANASDADGTITKVEFYNGSALLGTVTSNPYSYSWSNVAANTYSLTARATDNAGVVTTSTVVNIVVNAANNLPPTISITSPSNGSSYTAPASINLTATASDADGTISKVEFYNGSALLSTVTSNPYSYSWNNVGAGTYILTARAYDNLGLATTSSSVNVVVNNTGSNCTASGTILREYWSGVSGTSVSTVPINAIPNSTSQLSSFEAPTNFANNYGQRIRGYICILESGSYTFFISSDANSELWLSTDGNPSNKRLIASVSGTTTVRQWNKYPSQRSATITLLAGNPYYIEALHKEASGSDNLAVGWTTPASPSTISIIPGSVLSSYVNQVPTVSITSPASGTILTTPATIAIDASASDADGFINRVEFFRGTTKLGEDLTAPYNFTWSNIAAGTYSLTARARDNSGTITTSTAVSITVNAPPVVSVTSPTNGATFTAPASIPITATASDAGGTVSKVAFYNGATLLGEDLTSPYTFAWNNVATGTYSLTARATDNLGAVTTSAAISINVGTPPVVSITSPSNGSSYTAPASIPITAAASDADGTIAKVEFYNGATLLGTVTSSPYNFTWSNVAAGSYSLTARAYDNLGLVTTSSSISVVVNTPPVVSITSPANGSSYTTPASINLTATASDADGTISKVEFYNGSALLGTVTSNPYSYSWSNVGAGTYTLTARAYDNAGDVTTSAIIDVIVNAAQDPQVTVFQPTDAPISSLYNDGVPLQLGMKFRANANGYVTGVRFYKQPGNTGTHTGQLYNNTGTLLAQATFDSETASGWQEVAFDSPIAITANTTYIISYHSSSGYYSASNPYFTAAVDNGPLKALASGEDGGNGVYRYTSTPAYPSDSYQSANYWVDVVFNTVVGPDNTPPAVSLTTPVNNATNVNEASNITVTFSEAIDPGTISNATFELLNGSSTVPASITYNAGTRTATLDPDAALAYSTTYTAKVKGGNTDPTIKDLAENRLAADYTWSFTIRATPPPPPSPPPSVNDGPGGPILVISSSSNPFSRYSVEILRAEGLNEFAAKDISEVNSTLLASYDVIVLGEFPLQTSHVSMFTDWVNAGGTLIAFKPDLKLASLMGITRATGTLENKYILINTASGPGVGIVNQTIQYQGTADIYTLNGATRLATLYSGATTATINPAITSNNVGVNGGKAIAFTYDLARSIVYIRQGNPSWAGQKRSGTEGPVRAGDMFYPDWIDLNKVAIPQADEQQRLLANIILQSNLHKKPLPRFWYLPRGLKAAVIMTGDDHGNGGTVGRFNQYKSQSSSNTPQAVADWTAIRSTSYIYPGTPITDAQAAAFESQGFEIGLHLNTNCSNWTPTTWREFFNTQIPQLAAQLPSISPMSTHRTHCIAWSDWVNQAKLQSEYGIRLDGNYYYWPGAWVQDRPGMFTGSGLPMRFADSDGTLIDCYQATTQLTDESELTYTTHINTLLDNALGTDGYYGVFNANMHTDQVNSTGSDAIIASALARQVPVISAKQMLTWLDGRNNSSFGAITWNGSDLNFTITAASGSHNLRAMLPINSGTGALTGITLDGSPVTYTTETIKGIQYAFFPGSSGSYIATYNASNARLSSETVNSPSLLVYPNPSLGKALQVEAQGLDAQEDAVITLYNSVGGVVARFVEKADESGTLTKQLNFYHKLSSGIYTLILQSKKQSIRHKIIIAQ